MILNVPTFTICAATILDMGSETREARTHFGRHPRRRDPLCQLLAPNPAAAPTWRASSPGGA